VTTGAAAVREAAEAWRRAFEAKDVDAIVRAYAPDAVAMYSFPQPTVGREANREAWVAYFARPKATHPITTDTVVVAASGDLAYTFGRYRVNV
jgi:ketosteroid isomerase-like protein